MEDSPLLSGDNLISIDWELPGDAEKNDRVLTYDAEMGIGTDRFNARIRANLALVLAVVGQRSVCDLQIVDTGVLIAD